VQREYELDFVWVLEAEPPSDAGETIATARRRRVRAVPVPFRPDLVDVTSGLEEGELVATSNLRELAEGLRVRVALEEGSEVALP
jgi:hypothetical protein